MTTNELKTAGRDHFAAGKQLTPFDCQAIDARIYAAIRGTARPAKEYAKLRGAFNRGFMEAHVEAVTA
jgi:hypothetical protein